MDPLAANYAAWSAYNYVLGNPIRFVDPNGLYPIEIHVRSFAPFDYFGGRVWKGDGNNRPFSTSSDHTSRMRQVTSYETTTMASSTEPFGSPSHARYGANAFSDAYIEDDFSNGSRIHTHLSGDNDAFIPGIDYGGPTHDIDVWTDVLINSTENDDGSSILSITGNVAGDGFPSTEAFVSDDCGNSIFLGVGSAKAGPNKGPFWTLMGDKKIKQFNVNTRIAVDENGSFTGVYDGDQIISISEWNQQFEQQNPKGDN